MEIGILIGIIGLIYTFYTFDKRIKQLEETRGRTYSKSFLIYSFNAILKYPLFRQLSRVNSAIENQPSDKWSDAENDKFQKFINDTKAEQKSNIRLVYLSSEDAFVVETDGKTHTVLPGIGGNSIYSAHFPSIENILKGESFSFNIIDRHITIGSNKYCRVITGYLFDDLRDMRINTKAKILFDFPLEDKMTDDDFKLLGFEVERSDGDVYEDALGEQQSAPTLIKYKKNGVEIDCIF